MFRFANQRQYAALFREQGFDEESVYEMFELLASRGISDNPEELCDEPFRLTQLQQDKISSRFSDGSFPVFYSSLEPETAEAEARVLFLKNVSKPNQPRTAYYSRISCRFDGSIKDLRPMHEEWPNLTHDSDYRFCNDLGAEAEAADLDGLLTPSARRPNGTNLPVFRRRAISNPVVHALVAMTLDPSSGEITIHDKDVEGS